MSRPNLPLAAAAAAAMAMAPAAASAAEVQLQVSGPVVELTISESVSASPDLVQLTASVNALAPTASEALRQNAERMTRVIAAVEGQGVGQDDIRTSQISLNPQYEWDPTNQRQIFRGYQVSNSVEIKLHELPRTGRVLDALVTAGADEIGAITWSIEDPTTAQQQAREAAFVTARQRALGYARAAGYADVRLLEVTEGTPAWAGPQPLVLNAALETRNATMPIRPGEVQTSVTISVKFEMTR